ncbi:MAG: cyanophycinase [Filimonas sp.]|nr:cyanophycinase [Filimonas sp.]
MKKLFALLCCINFAICANAQKGTSPKGSLFIIGGGNRSEALMKQMIETAGLVGNDDAYIIVLPMASEQPDTGFLYLRRQLQNLTPATMRMFDFNKHDASDPKWNDSLVNAKLIYILGGDQNRFMKAVANTPVFASIHKAFAKGATIAGTSAGAAVMSKYMVTGKQLRDTAKYKETFDRLQAGNIEFAQGLGLLERTIIDQHFLKRSRYNRLISALADKPGYDCIGIDESTAIIVHGNIATVAGESQVLKFSATKPLGTNTNGLLKAQGITIDVFTAGDKVSLQP